MAHLVAWIWQESSRIRHLWRLTDSEVSSLFNGSAYPCNICGPRVIAERARAVDSAAIRAIVVRWLAPSEVWMPHYVGLDVSQKTTSICVVDEQGRRLWRGVCTTHPDPIATRVLRHAGGDAKIGIETGSMTPWLVHGLRAAGLDVACLDARRVKAALQMRDRRSTIGEVLEALLAQYHVEAARLEWQVG